jgi:hypothetical protein
MVLDLVQSEGFRAGGLIGTLAALALLLAPRRAGIGGAGIVGPGAVASVAALVGMAVTTSLPGALVGALALLATAACLAQRNRAAAAQRLLLASPGAVLVAVAADAPDPVWLGPFAIAATAATVTCLGDFLAAPRSPVRGFELALIVVTALGIYATVPETSQATVVVGALVPASVLALRGGPSSLDRANVSALAGLLVWTAAIGGQSRPSSVIGSVVCFGVLIADPPLVQWLSPRNRPAAAARARTLVFTLLLGGLHVGLVAVGSRVIGLRSSAFEAAVLAVITLLVAVVAVGALELTSRARGHRSR